MRLKIFDLIIYVCIWTKIESAQVKTTNNYQEEVLNKLGDINQNPNGTMNDAGNATKISFINPVGSEAPYIYISSSIQLHAFKNIWLSTPTSIKVFVSIITTSLLIGNLFSILVFRLAYRSGISKPLNVFICVDQAFKMFGSTWAIPVLAVSAILNSTYLQHTSEDQIPLVASTGETFCYVSRFVFEVFCGISISNIILGKA